MKTWLKKHRAAVPILLLGGCLIWSLWPVLAAMVNRWSTDPRYAHGYFVPVFSLALLWMRRDRLHERTTGRARRLGDWRSSGSGPPFSSSVDIIALVRSRGSPFCRTSGEFALLLGGWRALAWAWPSIAFLAFMVPLPWRVENALGPPLQSLATAASTYALQTLGLMAFAEGNVIQLNEARIGVVDACSGLSMLITFIALSTAVALVVRRPLLDRIVLIASSIPVALAGQHRPYRDDGHSPEMVGGHAATRFIMTWPAGS